MAKLCEVFDVNNYTFGTEDIIRVFLDEVQGKTTQYQPGKKYFFGDLIITSINNEYLIANKLKVEILDKDVAWFDAGTFENLKKASDYMYKIKKLKSINI